MRSRRFHYRLFCNGWRHNRKLWRRRRGAFLGVRGALPVVHDGKRSPAQPLRTEVSDLPMAGRTYV